MDFLSSIYNYIYLIIVTIISINVFNKYIILDASQSQPYPKSNAIYYLVIFCILFIGLRPVSKAFVDMISYDFQLTWYENYNANEFQFDTETENIIFDNFMYWWGCNGFSHTLFFLIMATIYFGCTFIGIKRLFPDHCIPAYLVFLAAFSTFSYGTNGIKAGAATSIAIMALGFIEDKKIISILLIFVSYGLHHSMKLVVVAYIIVLLFKNPKYFYYGWLGCLLMAILHVGFFQELFAGFTDQHGAGYLLATEETAIDSTFGSFRPDFILYSAMPVWIGYQYEIKHKASTSKLYKDLIHLYITTNATWMLCMYASFTNRIAYLSWFLYPIVIIYPFLDKENSDPLRYIKFKKVAIYHLCFTLFMAFIYYGLLSLGT